MEFFAGGTVAKFASGGHDVSVVVATDNDKGSFELSADELRAVRDRELNGAAAMSRGQASHRARVFGRRSGVRRAPEDASGAVHADHSRDTSRISLCPGTRSRLMRGTQTIGPLPTAANEAAAFAHFQNFYPEHLTEGLETHYVHEAWYFAKSPRDQNKFVDIDGQIETKIAALHKHEAQMVLTVQDMQFHLAASGLDVPWLADLDPHDYHAVIDKQMRAAGRAVAADPALIARMPKASGARATVASNRSRKARRFRRTCEARLQFLVLPPRVPCRPN